MIPAAEHVQVTIEWIQMHLFLCDNYKSVYLLAHVCNAGLDKYTNTVPVYLHGITPKDLTIHISISGDMSAGKEM